MKEYLPNQRASVAGLFKKLEEGKIEKGSTIVTVLTGNGLKDPDTAINYSDVKPVVLPNDEEVIINEILGSVKA